jgi:hypothetical protein
MRALDSPEMVGFNRSPHFSIVFCSGSNVSKRVMRIIGRYERGDAQGGQRKVTSPMHKCDSLVEG